MADQSGLTEIEEKAIEQVPGDAENVTSGPRPMLCPPACCLVVAGGMAKGYLMGREFYGDGSAADIELEPATEVDSDASVNEIITAIDG